MCEPLDENDCGTWLRPQGEVRLGICHDIGTWRLRTPVTDLVGRIDGGDVVGLEVAIQQAIGDAERAEQDAIAHDLRELAATLAEDDYLS